jgi:hypothetical protein
VETVKEDERVETGKTGSRIPIWSWSSTCGPTSLNKGSPIVFNTTRKILVRWMQVTSSRRLTSPQHLHHHRH